MNHEIGAIYHILLQSQDGIWTKIPLKGHVVPGRDTSGPIVRDPIQRSVLESALSGTSLQISWSVCLIGVRVGYGTWPLFTVHLVFQGLREHTENEANSILGLQKSPEEHRKQSFRGDLSVRFILCTLSAAKNPRENK